MAVSSRSRIYGLHVGARARLLVAPQEVERHVYIYANDAVTTYMAIDQSVGVRAYQWQSAPLFPGAHPLKIVLAANQALWGVTRGPLSKVMVTVEYVNGADPEALTDSLLLLFNNTPLGEFDEIARACIRRANVDPEYLEGEQRLVEQKPAPGVPSGPVAEGGA